MADDFRFDDLRPQEKPFKYLGRSFVAREPSAGAWAEHENALTRCYKYNAEGKLERYEGFNHLAPLLVGLCVYEIKDGKEQDSPVGDDVKKWQAKVVSPLYDWLKVAAGDRAEVADVSPKA